MVSRFPLYATSNSDLLHQAVERNLDGTVAWSCKVAADGVHPSKVPGHSVLPKTLQGRVGEELAGGLRLVYAGTGRAWKSPKEDYCLPCHYGADNVCMRCCATITRAPLSAPRG